MYSRDGLLLSATCLTSAFPLMLGSPACKPGSSERNHRSSPAVPAQELHWNRCPFMLRHLCPKRNWQCQELACPHVQWHCVPWWSAETKHGRFISSNLSCPQHPIAEQASELAKVISRTWGVALSLPNARNNYKTKQTTKLNPSLSLRWYYLNGWVHITKHKLL